MIVGSDCRRIPFFNRFMNTAATRPRSSARPVSFSTMEAKMTASSGVAMGRLGWRRSHAVARKRCISPCMRSSSSRRSMPLEKRYVSGSSAPSGGISVMSPTSSSSSRSFSTICRLVSPSGMVSLESTPRPCVSISMISAMLAFFLIS